MKTTSPTLNVLIKRHSLQRSLLDCEISQEQISEVSMLLDDWKKFARDAGLSEPTVIEIERGEFDESGRRYKALYVWCQKNAFLATYSEILSILLRIDRADIAEEVCRILKEDSRSSTSGKAFLLFEYSL